MNIVLSQEDADYILSYLRADLERVFKSSDELIEKQKEFKNVINDQKKDMGITEYLISQGLLGISDEMIKDSVETKTNLMKCIEILTVGSAICD